MRLTDCLVNGSRTAAVCVLTGVIGFGVTRPATAAQTVKVFVVAVPAARTDDRFIDPSPSSQGLADSVDGHFTR
jgi:hypothetical protein